MSLVWLYGSREDSSLVEEMRSSLATDFPDIKVGNITHWGGGGRNYQYFIQLTTENLPKGSHYEYTTDGYQGYFEFHLEAEPDDENFKRLKKIGIRLTHALENTPVTCKQRGRLPFGKFYYTYGGIRSMKDFVDRFKELYNIITPNLNAIDKKVVEVTLQGNPPKSEEPLKGPVDNNQEVTSEIMPLKKVMGLKLWLPDYQRDYCWEERNITDLWKNLLKIQKDKPFHLGTLILHANTEKGVYDIIDGQQRLVTLSLILWGLGYDGNLPLLSAEYTLPESIRNIGNCKFIIKSLIERSENRDDLLDNILKEVSFAVLVVNESNLDLAYTFFNNQNSKGVPLSDFDLLKAHHLRFIPGKEGGQAEHMAKKWNTVSSLPPSYGEANSLARVLGTHLYRLRKWMRRKDSDENSYRYVQHEFQAAPIIPDIPPFGEQFRFYEKIQGGTHFFVYVETFIQRFEQFCKLEPVKLLRKNLSESRYETFADSIETLLFGYYLKFGNQYIAEALFCIARLMALYRYNSYAVASSGVGVREFANNSEIILMIDQATSPTFFLAEVLGKFDSYTNGDYPIRTGLDLDEARGVRWGIYTALRNIFRDPKLEITDSYILHKIFEEYGRK